MPPYEPDRTWAQVCQLQEKGRVADVNRWPATRWQCTLQPPGCGGHLQFLAHSCTPAGGWDCAYSPASSLHGPRTEFSFPSATISEKTLRFRSNDTGVEALTAPPEAAAFEVYFNGTNFCPIEKLRTFTYGPPSERTRFVCTVRTITSNVVSCLTSPSAYGPGNAFTVWIGPSTAAAVSFTGTDVLNYIGSEEFPVITAVHGCPRGRNNATVDCPTQGNIQITLTGSNFFQPVVVYVNGKPCVVPDVIDKSHVSCTLPAGAGYDQLVMLSSLNRLAVPVPLLSYAMPVIRGITYSDQRLDMCKMASSTALRDCPRMVDNFLITITGDNFGPAFATLFVGLTPQITSSWTYVHLATLHHHSLIMCCDFIGHIRS